jgi:hypothetical protein
VYLDADIVLGRAPWRALVRVLEGQVHAAAPIPRASRRQAVLGVRSY